MISLDSNLSEIWSIINTPSPQSKNNDERIEFLTFQLQKLVDKIPTEDFVSLEPTVVPPKWLQAGLKRFCHLRVHHIKILSQIGTFGSIRDFISQPASAKSLLTSAVKSVDLHSEMVDAGETSPLLLPTAVKLLLSSLSIMLFTVSHRPEEYGPMCSKPFQTAINILHNLQNCVKDLDLKIWSTLEVLEKIAELARRHPLRHRRPCSIARKAPATTSIKELKENPLVKGTCLTSSPRQIQNCSVY
jgi:hypothetical protein